MYGYQFCQKFMQKSLPESLHDKRATCLTNIVGSMLSYGKQLSLTEIGRHLNGPAAVKHKIKSVDRFIGNGKINKNIKDISKSICHFIFKHFKTLFVLVDWSGACQEDMHVLQASVAFQGRSIPIYAEIHPSKDTGTKQTHDYFLENLADVIPRGIQVEIITDAGFHRDWFCKVKALGWDFTGKIYSKYQYKPDNSENWEKVSDFKFKRDATPFKVGKVYLGKTKIPLLCEMYTYKQKVSKRPHKKNPYPDHEKSHSSYYKNGWVIVSSLDKPAKFLIRSYKKRMQIEQNFRDIKNQDLGLGLKRNKSSGINRIQALYFIAMIISIVLWWIGYSSEKAGLHRKYQANTTRSHRVISFVKLGRLIVSHEKGFNLWRWFIKKHKELSSNFVKLMNDEPSYGEI